MPVHPKDHKLLKPSAPGLELTATLIVRRRPDGPKLRELKDFSNKSAETARLSPPASRPVFAAQHGADPKELAQVAAFAREQGLKVESSDPARRSVVVRGPVSAINRAFAIEMHDYKSADGQTYQSHEGPAKLPAALAKIVEAVTGLHTRPVPAIHYAKRPTAADPASTGSLTPQQVAALYDFPAGAGAGQTIGIYEMTTSSGPAGYSVKDITATIKAFGGGLKVPQPIDVSVDGVANSGVSDGETGLDITVAAAIAPEAKLAVYFTGPTPQNIIHALQSMIHPAQGQPEPTIISISYGWGPDDETADGFSAQEYAQIDQLFQDAANLAITALVSSGDNGAYVISSTQAQTSFPASSPWVIACGGTVIGNVKGSACAEYAWNDSGASGGGISARFPVPDYQAKTKLPKHNRTKKAGRGIPDIAGNASPYSGYIQYIQGQSQTIGGTSAVAPLYAGLIARINANLGASVGFINPVLYTLAATTFRDIVAPPGPLNNSYNGVTGYPVTVGWDACTGLGSVKGVALQTGLRAAKAGGPAAPGPAAPAATLAQRVTAAKKSKKPAQPVKVFKSGTFKGVPVSDPFAQSANDQEPIVVSLGSIPWPAGLAPQAAALGSYAPGTKITGPVNASVDVLIVLYTEPETQALLEVFTGNNSWTAARRKEWCGYAHNFAKFKPIIEGIDGDTALEQGMFGYLSAVKIGGKNVALYKSELHPKQNGAQLPFIPVLQQLIGELSPALVISTGTAGAIGTALNCGDVAVTSAARFHVEKQYPSDPQIDTMSASQTELTSAVSLNATYLNYAAAHFTKLSLPGLGQCHQELQKNAGYGFVKKNTQPPRIYVTTQSPAPGPQPMTIVSADYLTVDDNENTEGLQALGIMNDTDDAFLFYAISQMSGAKPAWLSVRNASEPQIAVPASGAGGANEEVTKLAGVIYGIYQYCTTLNSAFACWGIVAGM